MRYVERGNLDAQCLLDEAWESFLAGNLGEAWTVLVRMRGNHRLSSYALESPSSLEKLRLCRCLLSYRYPHLQEIPDDVRKEFAIVEAWHSLLAHCNRFDVWDRTERLAVLLGTGYLLNLDPEDIRATWGEAALPVNGGPDSLPFGYNQFAKLWPNSRSLPSLSLGARSTIVRAIWYVQPSGLVDYQRLGPQGILRLEQCLEELAQADLVVLKPAVADLLMNATLTQLKQLAHAHGLRTWGPKWKLAEEIAAFVKPQAVDEFLRSLAIKKQILLRVDNLPLVKKFLWAETHRMSYYLFFVRRWHCLDLPPVHYGLREAGEAPPCDTHMQPWVRMSQDPTAYLSQDWCQEELRLVRELWDEQCDAIIRGLADMYAWDAPWYMTESILAYFSLEQRQAFEDAWEAKRTRGNALMYYGEARLVQMGVKIREPRLLECKGCGKQFREWSIHTRTAMGVGYRIHFCSSCYGQAFNTRIGPTSRNRDEMIGALADLAAALDAVPTATLVRNPSLESVSDEKQIAIVRALINLAPYQAYVEVFGSWLNALKAAGILTNRAERWMIGTHCIAIDGHECHSLAEKSIDDWLSARGIDHEREPVYPYHACLNPTGRLRADWAVQETFIEYAGLMDQPEYAAKMETKRMLADQFGITLVVLEPDDVLNLDSKLGHLAILH